MIIGWLFTAGALVSFIVLFLHSLLINDLPKTGFLFGGGFLVSLSLEYTLSIVLQSYGYRNLPLLVFKIPVAIPCGWIITFYSIYWMTTEGKQLTRQNIIFSAVIAGLFGMAIESLARIASFWEFHFTSVSL